MASVSRRIKRNIIEGRIGSRVSPSEYRRLYRESVWQVMVSRWIDQWRGKAS